MLGLIGPARGFDTTCEGFELVEAEFSVEAVSVVGHRSWLKMYSWEFPRCTHHRRNQWTV